MDKSDLNLTKNGRKFIKKIHEMKIWGWFSVTDQQCVSEYEEKQDLGAQTIYLKLSCGQDGIIISFAIFIINGARSNSSGQVKTKNRSIYWFIWQDCETRRSSHCAGFSGSETLGLVCGRWSTFIRTTFSLPDYLFTTFFFRYVQLFPSIPILGVTQGSSGIRVITETWKNCTCRKIW